MGKAHNKGKGKAVRWLRDHVSYDGNDCLIWPFSISRGYGMFGYLGEILCAHRFMCELVHGPAPTPKHETAHSCGNGHKACVHPKHVSWKLPVDNAADRKAHGTSGWPSSRGGKRYKLTAEQVAEIRAMRGKATSDELGQTYGVAQTTIVEIWNGRTWKQQADGTYSRGGFAKGDPRNPLMRRAKRSCG